MECHHIDDEGENGGQGLNGSVVGENDEENKAPSKKSGNDLTKMSSAIGMF